MRSLFCGLVEIRKGADLGLSGRLSGRTRWIAARRPQGRVPLTNVRVFCRRVSGRVAPQSATSERRSTSTPQKSTPEMTVVMALFCPGRGCPGSVFRLTWRKIVQLFAHAHGCILRCYCGSASASPFYPGPEHTPGTSGPKEGRPFLVLKYNPKYSCCLLKNQNRGPGTLPTFPPPFAIGFWYRPSLLAASDTLLLPGKKY